jgi:integrase
VAAKIHESFSDLRSQAPVLFRKMMDDAVTPDTIKGYKRCIGRMAAIAACQASRPAPAPGHHAGLHFTKADFITFLAACAENGMAGTTARLYFTTIKYYQGMERFGLADGELPWSFEPAVATAVKGLKYMAKDPARQRPVRGSITQPMMANLCRWAAQNGFAHCVIWISVQFGVAARRSQMLAMRKGDVDTSKMRILLRKDKRVNANSASQSQLHHKSIDHNTLLWIRAAEKGLPDGALLFPRNRCPFRDVDTAIKKAAADLCWLVEGVYFTSNHSLRHGGTSHRINKIEEAVRAAVVKEMTQMSSGISKHYNQSNLSRSAKRGRS